MSKTKTKNIKRMKKLNAHNRKMCKSLKEERELSTKWKRLALTLAIYAIIMLLVWLFKKYV